jgi:outer membrane biosynthesis protein TonB
LGRRSIRTDAIVAPSDDRAGWQVRLSAEEALSLVSRLGEARAESRRDSAIIAAWDKDSVDSPVQPRWQGMKAAYDIRGRVLAQFVVDPSGRADMRTFTVILASDPVLEDLARAIIRRSRFEPATRQGRPVPQLVSQQLMWY